MQDIQRRLLVGEPGQRIELLRACCQSVEGIQWCRQRFSLHEVLDWMWKEGQGDFSLLAHWQPDPELVPLLQALVPEGYQSSRLAALLFPAPGSYRLDEHGISGPRSQSIPANLCPLLRRRARDLKPPTGYRWRESSGSLALVAEDSVPRLSLSQVVLEDSGAEMVAYGAKDNGEMGGGASGALLVAAGPALEDASRQQLARCAKEIGEVYLTPAFGDLLESGVQWVCHIISILKYTDEGSWCPQPERLEDGVLKALALADAHQLHSIAFSALGTGEGRVSPEQCARLMIGAARKYLQEHPQSPLRVTMCLPTERDYQAFKRALSSES